MNYDESTVERLCSANNFCGMPMWLKYQNYLFSTVEEKPNIKVLLSTGYSMNGQAKEILARGCLGFMQKPFNLRDLSQKLRGILDLDRSLI